MTDPTSTTVEAIYAHHANNQGSSYRPHMGGSIIGTECDRALWYGFRWSTSVKHEGRLLRLFDRGQLEEARFVKALRAVGVTVLDVDPDTGRQFKLRDDSGHIGGEMDAVAIGFRESPDNWALVEMKTHSAKSFASLVKEGVEKSKPLHWAQMHVYAGLADIDHAFYFAVNKDTDALYSQWIAIDKALSLRLLAKAKRIVDATEAPGKISRDPSWFKCRFCDHHAVCHGDAVPASHCRSCAFSTPTEKGTWTCEKHNEVLSLDAQRNGCGDHLYLPSLIHGEQVDVDPNGKWIEYRMTDGSLWRDEVVPF